MAKILMETKLIKLLKDSMAEFWILYIVAFLCGSVIGGCLTYNYILKRQDNAFHEIIRKYDERLKRN